MAKNYDMAIVGGGASGIFLAALLSNRGFAVAICEADSRIGRKLLMTGNGKCNMLNCDTAPHNYNTSYVTSSIDKYNCDKLRDIFYNDFRLLTREDDGRIYPYSGTATSVLNALRDKLSNVDIYTDCAVSAIVPDGSGYCVVGAGTNIYASSVTLATGSAASIGYNSHSLYSAYGHKTIELRPSLLPLVTESKDIAAMQGLRHYVRASLIDNGKVIGSSIGEMLFKASSLSGIVSFELSSMMARANIDSAVVSIDFMPDHDSDRVEEILKHTPLDGILHKMLAQTIAKSVNGEVKAIDIKHYKVNVRANHDRKMAQVYCGGLDTHDFSPTTMQSRLKSGLYAVGEALDVDGDCGGYNLHWAWASAAMLAEHYHSK